MVPVVAIFEDFALGNKDSICYDIRVRRREKRHYLLNV